MPDVTTPSPARFEVPSTGGVTLAAYRWEPEGPPRAVVQLAHGLGEHALRYDRFARALTAAGYAVYSHDHRGHGATMGDGEPGVIGADGWHELVEDIGRVGAVATAEHPGVPRVLMGHSMGSFATQQYLATHPEDHLDAVILSGTAAIDPMIPLMDFDAPLDLSAYNAPFAPARTDFDWLSRDEAEVDLYVADPLCGFGFDAAGSKAMFDGSLPLAEPGGLSAIDHQLPLYVVVGEHDPVNGQLALVHLLVDRYRAAGLTDVTLTVYPGARHEVLNETNRDEVTADIVAWLDAKVG